MAIPAPNNYWKLDEASGNAADASGAGVTLTNGGSTPYAAAKINNGANFGTSNTNKQLTSSTEIYTGGNFSFSIWINPNNLADTENKTSINIIHKSTGKHISIYIDHNADIFYSYFAKYGEGTAALSNAGSAATSTWYHFVVTFDGTNLRTYRNGSLYVTTAVSFPGPTTSWGGNGIVIGGTLFGGSTNFARTLVDEVGWWNGTVLDSTAVSELYNSGAGKPYPYVTAWTTTLTESVTLVDTILKQPAKVLSDVVTLVDTIIKNTTMRVLTEIVVLVDTFSFSKLYNTVLTETVVLVDSIVRDISKVLSDVVTIVDVFERNIVAFRVYLESITLVDVVSKMAGKMFEEAVSITDTFYRAISKVFTDAMTLVDSFERMVARTFTEIVTLVDTIVTAASRFRTFVESITLNTIIIRAITNFVGHIPFLKGTRSQSQFNVGKKDEDGGMPGTRF